MAGPVLFTYDDGADRLAQHCNLKQVVASWTSDAAGNATGTSGKIAGKLVKAITIPGAGGAQPTNGYAITITDPSAVNILASCKASLASNSNAATAETYFFVLDTSATPVTQAFSPVVCDPITFTITNAGNVKSGAVALHYSPL